MKLSDYQTQTAQLLHDASYQWTSQGQLTNLVNEARYQAAKRTGCIQRLLSGQSAYGASAQPGSLIPGAGQPGALPGAFPNAQNNATQNTFQTIQNVERYPFQGFANPYLRDFHQGCDQIMDVASISVTWGTSPRPTINWLPWEELQAYARAYENLVTSYSVWWSVLNDGTNGEVWLYPAPPQNLEMEWLVYALPKAINTDDDYDAIPDSASDSIKFLAASLAFMSSQRWAQSQIMENMFAERLGIMRVSVDRGKVPAWYS